MRPVKRHCERQQLCSANRTKCIFAADCVPVVPRVKENVCFDVFLCSIQYEHIKHVTTPQNNTAASSGLCGCLLVTADQKLIRAAIALPVNHREWWSLEGFGCHSSLNASFLFSNTVSLQLPFMWSDEPNTSRQQIRKHMLMNDFRWRSHWLHGNYSHCSKDRTPSCWSRLYIK